MLADNPFSQQKECSEDDEIIMILSFFLIPVVVIILCSLLSAKIRRKISQFWFCFSIEILKSIRSADIDEFDRRINFLLVPRLRFLIAHGDLNISEEMIMWAIANRFYYSGFQMFQEYQGSFEMKIKLFDLLLIDQGIEEESTVLGVGDRIKLLNYLCRLGDFPFPTWLKQTLDINPVELLVKNYDNFGSRDYNGTLESLIDDVIDYDRTFIQQKNEDGLIPYQVYLEHGYNEIHSVHSYLLHPEDLKTLRFTTEMISTLSTEHLKELLEMGLNPSLPLLNSSGERPLFAPNLCLPKVQLLLEHNRGMVIDYECSTGATALMYQLMHYMNTDFPSEYGNIEQWKICRLLIKNGANPNHRDYDGQNVFDLLEDTEHRNLISVEELKELVAKEVAAKEATENKPSIAIGSEKTISIDF